MVWTEVTKARVGTMSSASTSQAGHTPGVGSVYVADTLHEAAEATIPKYWVNPLK